MKRKIAISFMAVGILLIGFAMGLLIYNNYENQKARESSDLLVESIRLLIEEDQENKNNPAGTDSSLGNTISRGISENESEEPISDPFDEEMKIEEIDGYGYIGYLSIPSLGLDLPVMSEWDYSRLKIAPCRYYGSTKTDNLVIAAHNYKGHFGYLKNLQAGDLVMFTDMDSEVYYYNVDLVESLMPTDVDKVKDCGNDLVLYTCTYGGAERIVVRCSYNRD